MAVCIVWYQTTTGAGFSSRQFQDTAKIKKAEPHKTIKLKSSNSPHKGKPVAPQKKTTNNRSKKETIHPKKPIGIDHPAPDQQRLDSIVKAKDKEKSQVK